MQLTLTVEQLVAKQACPEGVDAFRELFGADQAVVKWTKEKQIELLLTPIGKYIVWAWREGLIPMWAMDGARLVGASLVGARLVGASLDGARLDGARLVGASLDGARLDGASLVGASLVGASLVGASLDRAKVCLCSDGACVRLREFLALWGWAPGAGGLPAKTTAEAVR